VGVGVAVGSGSAVAQPANDNNNPAIAKTFIVFFVLMWVPDLLSKDYWKIIFYLATISLIRNIENQNCAD
jgi:hypothetical protein